MFFVAGQPVTLVDSIVDGSPYPGEYGIPLNDVGSFEAAGSVHGEYRLTDYSQTFPAGRFRFISTGDAVELQRLTSGSWTLGERTPWTGTTTTLASWSTSGAMTVTIPADTTAAYTITDGTVSYYVIDTRTTTTGAFAHTLDAADVTLVASAGSSYGMFTIPTMEVNFTGATQVLVPGATISFAATNIAGAEALTVNAWATVRIAAPTEGNNITLIDAVGLRIINAGGTPTNLHGILIDTLTAGATANYAITIGTTDVDQNLIHVGVDGDPTLAWDESGDAFTLTANFFVLNGRGILIGHDAKITTRGAIQSEFQVLGTGDADSRPVIGRFSANGSGPALFMLKSRAAIGSFALVSDGDVVLDIIGLADDGTNYQSESVRIRGEIDGTAAENDTPGRLIIALTAAGAQGSTERWRFTSVGVLTSIAGTPANAATADGSIIATGGIAFTDVANAWIDDATHGSGTVTHYIGNNTIDVTASDARVKDNIAPVNGAGRCHLDALAGILREYDYIDGSGHFVGLVAQDVMRVLPQYVVGSEEQLSLRYHYMVGPLLWGWQDHEGRISGLDAKLEELEGKLTAIAADDWLKTRFRDALEGDDDFRAWARAQLVEG